MYRVGDPYRVQDRREPVGTIEAIVFFEDFLGDRPERRFGLVVVGEIVERSSERVTAPMSQTQTKRNMHWPAPPGPSAVSL